MNINLPIILFLTITACGCSAVSHMDQLLTLKSLTDEQKKNGREVEKKNADFDMLLAMVKSGDISYYKNKKSLVDHFGLPILSRERTEGGQKISEWVYRYQTQFFDSPKVYLQFNEQNELIKSFAVDAKT